MIRVLRLNSRTFPVLPEERAALDPAEFELSEAELPEDYPEPEKVDAVMIVSAYFREDMLKKFPNLRIISRLGNGCDKIDLAAAGKRGIPVVNVPDSFSEEVAEHTVAMILALLRKLPQHDAMMRQGRRPLDVFGLRRISSLTLGVVGFGLIGRLTAELMRAFNMRVIFCDPGVPDHPEWAQRVDLPTLLEESDVVTLQCPLLPATRGMIGMEEFRRMKPDAVLVNTARGELVREAELAEALRTGVIAAAGLDVFADFNVFTEGGFLTEHPLFGLDNVIMTPHVAANSIQGRADAHGRGAAAVADFFHRKPLKYLVNGNLLKEAGK